MLKLKLAFLPLALGLAVLSADLARADVVAPSATIAARSAAPLFGQEKLVGRVQRVQGVTVVLALDNGTIRSVDLPDAAGGDFQFLVGQRIVLTQVICVAPVELPPQPRVITPQRW
jgi:hypothetical protein